MNPDSAIRPWLLAVGKQFGIREAHNYRWSDASTRPQEPYFIYRVYRSRPTQKGIQRQSSSDGYTAIHSAWCNYETIVRIELFREVNGVEILNKCNIAAQENDQIKQHFKKSGCAFQEIYEDIEDETPNTEDMSDSSFIDQIKQRMEVVFFDNVIVALEEANGVVESLDINLGLT